MFEGKTDFMPERQSSPGEATTRSDTDAATSDSTHGPNGSRTTGPAGPHTNGSAAGADPAPPVAEQVTEQVAAEPGAVDPAPAGPGDDTADGGEPVMTGDRAVDIAEAPAEPAADAPAAPTAAPPAPADGPPQKTSLFEPITPPEDGRSMSPARPGTPAPADAPTTATRLPTAGPSAGATPDGTPASGAGADPTESSVEATTAVPAVAPRPRPRPGTGPSSVAGDSAAAGDDTVRTPATGDGPTRPTPTPTDAPTPGPPTNDPPGTDAPTVAVAAPTSATAPSGGAPTWDAEATQVIPRSSVAQAPSATGPADPPTERIPVAGGGAAFPPPTPLRGTGRPGRPGSRRPLLIVAAVLAVLVLGYAADLFLSSGSVPRGVTVAGVGVGGLSLADAEQRLRTEIEPRTTVPVEVTVGEVSTQIDPTTAGLSVDWAGTLDRAGEQPLNPITRITSFFTQRELGVATTVDRAAVDGALGELGPIVDRQPTEGTVRFEGTTPIAVDPVPGQQLDQPAAVEVLARDWASGRPVALPLIALPARTTPEDVASAIADVAGPAVSGPVTVLGEGGSAGTLEPAVIAEALTFEPGAESGLEPVLNPTVITDALDDQLAGSEREAVDASLDFSTNPATVVPSQDGRGVDYDATLADLLTVLTGTGPREITAVYADQPAEVTTEELQALGTAGVISEFQTGGFAGDSGQNIRRAAELVNGVVVAPGETFSLDQVTGPRTAANGYVEAGVIDNGQPGRGIAGGVSQVSTTLFNAAYFAGMTDVRHQAHSFYISRYPPGREATIATGAIDMQFRNDTPTAVLIQTVWTPSSITVRLLGTKYYEVESLTGPRTNPTSPNTVNVPAGEPCNPSGGAPGFTITDTRRLTDVRTGEVRTDPTTTTRYNPSPRVVCG